jgi:hypothetical protein
MQRTDEALLMLAAKLSLVSRQRAQPVATGIPRSRLNGTQPLDTAQPSGQRLSDCELLH